MVYMLKFRQSIGTKGRGAARYYIGYADDKKYGKRIAAHRAGQSGVRICREFFLRGIGFDVVMEWPGRDRAFERRLKRAGHYVRHDPIPAL